MAGRFICSGGKVFGPEINLRDRPSSENHLAHDKLPVKFPVSIEEKQCSSLAPATCIFPGIGHCLVLTLFKTVCTILC